MQNVDLINVLINWFPMLLLIAVWVWFLRKMRTGMYPKYQQDYLGQLKRQNDALERIALTLEKRDR